MLCMAAHRFSFEIRTVSPVGVMGKSFSQREDSTSTGLQFSSKIKSPQIPLFKCFATRTLNLQAPENRAKIIYKNDLAKLDLDMSFHPAEVPLNRFSK